MSHSWFQIKSAGDSDAQRLAICGMSRHLPRWHEQLQLERLGPFVPPMSLPFDSDVVVTPEFCERLRQAGFSEWTTNDVRKALVVSRDWQSLDVDDWEGEPEMIILGHPHDEAASVEMGPLFELLLPIECRIWRPEGQKWWQSQVLECDRVPTLHFCFGQRPGGRMTLCSDVFRDWIATQPDVAKWLVFIPSELRVK